MNEPFPIGFWNHLNVDDDYHADPERVVRDWAEAGMTLAQSPYFENQNANRVERIRALLDTAARQGVRVMLRDGRTRWPVLTREGEDAYRAAVARTVGLFGGHPALWGFMIGDEPGADAFDDACRAYRVVREMAPDHSPFLNLLPWFVGVEARVGYECSADAEGIATLTAASASPDVGTDVSDGQLTIMAPANWFGATNITVTADDGKGGTASDTFVLTVAGSPDAPIVLAPLDDATRAEDTGPWQFSLDGVFTDADGDPLTLTAFAVDVTPFNDPPTVDSLVVSPSIVRQTETLTLTATVSDVDDASSPSGDAAPAGAVAAVEFYHDANDDGVGQPDEMLGTDSTAGDGSSLPADLGDFARGASIDKVSVKDLFADSLVAARRLGKVDVGGIDTSNAGDPFGLSAETIASVTYQRSTGDKATLKQPDASTAIGDFRIDLL